MMPSTRRERAGTALVGVGVLLLVLPAVFPVGLVPVHDTNPTTTANGTQLEEDGVTVIAYGNLSDRGQELYVESLERPGEYHVVDGDGAPEFPYPRPDEREQTDGDTPVTGLVAIDRAGHQEELRQADEFGRDRRTGGGGAEVESGSDSVEEAERQRAVRERYDLVATRMDQPPLDAPAQLVRLASVLLAVVCLGVGGYLLSSRQ